MLGIPNYAVDLDFPISFFFPTLIVPFFDFPRSRLIHSLAAVTPTITCHDLLLLLSSQMRKALMRMPVS